jgi:hypothetical protein
LAILTTIAPMSPISVHPYFESIPMSESTNPALPSNAEQQAQLDLLHSVLDSASTMPWHPYSPAATQYFDQLEQTVADELGDDLEIASQWSKVSALANALWASSDNSLLTTLAQKFGDRMPQELLTQLTTQVQAVAQSGQTLMDQLVTAAQAVVTNVAVDDLQVVARPMAMAMRSGEADSIEAAVQSIRAADWDELSEMEQAKLSLAIARYALAKLDAEA